MYSPQPNSHIPSLTNCESHHADQRPPCTTKQWCPTAVVHHIYRLGLCSKFRHWPIVRGGDPSRPFRVFHICSRSECLHAGLLDCFPMDPTARCCPPGDLAARGIRTRASNTSVGMHRYRRCEFWLQSKSSRATLHVFEKKTSAIGTMWTDECQNRWEFYVQLFVMFLSQALVNSSFRVLFSEMIPAGSEVRWFGMQLVLSCATVRLALLSAGTAG